MPTHMWKDPCRKCESPFDYTCYLVEIDTVTILFGSVLLVGTVFCFGPQIVKLAQRKNTKGLSFFTMWLASVNGWSLVCNFFMSQFPQVVACQNDFEECLRNNLP